MGVDEGNLLGSSHMGGVERYILTTTSSAVKVLLISVLRLNLVLTYGIPPELLSGGIHLFLFKPSYAIGSVPSLSGHAIAYRCCSLPTVRRHRASSPQGSSERVLPCPAGLSSDLYPPRSIEGKTRTKLCQKRPQVTGLRSSPELRPV